MALTSKAIAISSANKENFTNNRTRKRERERERNTFFFLKKNVSVKEDVFPLSFLFSKELKNAVGDFR